jgi:hypothetical protein
MSRFRAITGRNYIAEGMRNRYDGVMMGCATTAVSRAAITDTFRSFRLAQTHLIA